jgi:DNA-binding CsgD family transcriptional regulator
LNTDPKILVDRIYEAAAMPDAWPSVLHDLAGQAGGACSGLLVRRSDAWIGWRFSPGVEEVSAAAYLRSEAAGRSTTMQRLARADRARFLADHEAYSDEEYRADPLISDWAVPNALYHGAATGISTPAGDYVMVWMHRRTGAPRFDAGDLAQLDRFRPHLARAALLASRWRLERLRAMTEALELIGLPAAVLDGSGRALAANALIQEMGSHVIWLPGDRLSLIDRVAADLLRQALVAVRIAAAPGGRSFPAYASDGGGPVVVHLIPISGESRDLFAGGLGLIVLGALRGVQAPIIGALYDFTPAETEVAILLAEGLAPAQIASQRGVSLDTVRNQIKALLQKTGADRLGSLIALLAKQLSPPAGAT